MKKYLFLFLLFSSISVAQELRGIWLSRNELTNKANIAAIMDSLASMNFNVVYVNAWSRGYPLFQSDVFFQKTGLTIDPLYAGRDILAEAIAEGHRRGMSVEAWFEYGFVGGFDGYLPGTSGKGKIFDVHPEWTAKKSDGSEANPLGSGGNFYWMAHSRPDVQKFLLDLHMEVARKYDIDGIEFDRIRYAGNVYGYDQFTDSLWKASHGGAAPPANAADPEWMRFRADILNNFMRRAYDSIKAINPHVMVTNAPGFYSSSSYQSYNDNLQDWFQWVETGSVDHVQVQMYVSSANTLNAYLNYIFSNPIRSITKKEKIFPALAFAPNGNAVATTELQSMVTATRTRGMFGNAWWYYGDLNATYNNYLRTTAYPTKAEMPGRPAGWRTPGIIINEGDSGVVKSDGWVTTNIKGFAGFSFAADSAENKWIEYTMDVPASGWYEVYAYQVTSGIRTLKAPFDLFDSSGTSRRVLIDQQNVKNTGWVKVGDAYLHKGKRKVLRLSNENIGANRSVSADAVMLIVNRKLSPTITVTGAPDRNFTVAQPNNFWLGQNFPNPFNPETTIRFRLPSAGPASVAVYDLLGRRVATAAERNFPAGVHSVTWNGGGFPSGLYFYRLHTGAATLTKKMLLLR